MRKVEKQDDKREESSHDFAVLSFSVQKRQNQHKPRNWLGVTLHQKRVSLFQYVAVE